MDETINEDDVNSLLRLYNSWQNFLVRVATNNLSGQGTWAGTLLRELQNIISMISVVTLNEFCGNCDSFLTHLAPDEVPSDLPAVAEFDKFHEALKILDQRVSRCQTPIVFKYPQPSLQKAEILSSVKFDKRITTASKLNELKFIMGKQNYFDLLGQVISVVHTKKSRTILRVWDATFPSSRIATERSFAKLYQFVPDHVVETIVEDKTGLLQQVPLKYCLDIDLYGRSLPMAKDMNAGDIVLIANVHLNWRKHDDYIMPTMHDGSHEFKFDRGIFHVQPNHARYFDLIGSITNELLDAHLSGLNTLMESFSHDSRNTREQAEASIMRARNHNAEPLSRNVNSDANARLIEELMANDSSLNIQDVPGPSNVQPLERSPLRNEGKLHVVEHDDNQLTNRKSLQTVIKLSPASSTKRCSLEVNTSGGSDVSRASFSSFDLNLTEERIEQEGAPVEDKWYETPRRSSRLLARTSPQAPTELPKENHPASPKRRTRDDMREVRYSDLNLSIEDLEDSEDPIQSRQQVETGHKESEPFYFPAEDLELSIEQISNDDEDETLNASGSQRDNPESERSYAVAQEDLELSMEILSEGNRHDTLDVATQDLELSMEVISHDEEEPGPSRSSPRNKRKRKNYEAEDSTLIEGVASRTRSHDRSTRKKSRADDSTTNVLLYRRSSGRADSHTSLRSPRTRLSTQKAKDSNQSTTRTLRPMVTKESTTNSEDADVDNFSNEL